jgi:hypothetical protein
METNNGRSPMLPLQPLSSPDDSARRALRARRNPARASLFTLKQLGEAK